MISLQANLEIARRALQAHQLAMSVIGNNIANVNTPGYSRRSTVLQQTTDFETRAGMVGTGVEAIDIRRARDKVLDGLLRHHLSNGGRWAGMSQTLARVETVFNEPGDTGLSETMGRFWTAWNDLAREPENQSLRAMVVERGGELTASFRRIDSHLMNLQNSLTGEASAQVSRINTISDRLAELNRTIVQGEVGGREASALRDERDLLIDQLSDIVNVQVQVAEDGAATVLIGSEVLVQGSTGRQLEMLVGTGKNAQSSRIVWEGSSRTVPIAGGRLGGYIAARDINIAGYRESLDDLAAGFVSEVNGLHSAGVGLNGTTGIDFFDPNGVTATTFDIAAAVAADLDLVAASAGGGIGDGDQALALANLEHALTMSGGSATFNTFYNTLTGKIGLDSQEASSFLATEEVLILDLENQRLEVSGVSIDEEMTYLLSHQHAYEAMIRVTATIDEMMATLISAF